MSPVRCPNIINGFSGDKPMKRLAVFLMLSLCLSAAVAQDDDASAEDESPAGATAQTPEAPEDSAADDSEVDADSEEDDADLDEQTYEEDEDDFIPTEEIPADEPIAFPSNI
jgi:hypothetical protein